MSVIAEIRDVRHTFGVHASEKHHVTYVHLAHRLAVTRDVCTRSHGNGSAILHDVMAYDAARTPFRLQTYGSRSRSRSRDVSSLGHRAYRR
jgi:hypothetical protein